MKLPAPLVLLAEVWRGLAAHDAPRAGAALAYYAVFSLAPIVVIVVAVAGAVFGEDAARGELAEQLRATLGAAGARVVEDVVARSNQGGGSVFATIVGFGTLGLRATSIFVELRATLDRIFEVPPCGARGILATIRARAASFGLVLLVGALLLVSVATSAALAAAGAWLAEAVDLPRAAFTAADPVVSLLLVTALFAAIYRWLPVCRAPWADVGVGAAGAAALFLVGKLALGAYIGRSGLETSYGGAGALVALLVWVYWSSQILLFGAELVRARAHRRGWRATPTGPAAAGP